MKKLFGLVIVLGFCAFVVGVFIVAFALKLPSVASLKEFRPPVATEVFSDEYIKIGEFFRERRIFLPLHQTPPLLVKAFISAEDAEFFQHKGVSPVGIARAFFKNLLAGGVKQGGSTITQQVAKSLLLTPERSLLRKARELVLALKMEKFLSKEEILEIYLNQVYLGHSAYGVQAASQVYFDKDVASLSLSQLALLAGLTKAPSQDNPNKDPIRATNRRNYVLKRMQEEGYITKEQEMEAKDQPLDIAKETNLNVKYAPYFIEYVRQYAQQKYGDDAVLDGGLQIFTTLRVRDALASTAALRDGLEELDRHQGFRGPVKHFGDGERKAFQETLVAEQPSDPSDISVPQKALVIDVKDKEGLVFIDLGFSKGVIPFETLRWARKPNADRFWESDQISKPSQALKVGDVIWVRIISLTKKLEKPLPKGVRAFSLYQEPLVQGAIISMDPVDGSIRAMVGGYDFEKSEFNRATQAKRQPGSAFKPIIYTAALDNGFTPARVIVDAPIVYDDPTRAYTWKPKNYEGDFEGDMIFRECLIKSRNVPTVKILQEIGVDAAIQYAKKFGITSDLARDFSLALGSSAVIPLELVSAYTVFATGGRRSSPIAIKKIVDRDGHDLERNVSSDPSLSIEQQVRVISDRASLAATHARAIQDGKQGAPLPANYVISPQTAFLMTHLLKEVIRVGTGQRAQAINRPAAGKTGTTNDNNDAWFIGYTPDLIAGVWIGFDQATSLGVREAGGASATPIWLDYMQDALKDRPVIDFPVPEGVVFAQIDPKTGRLATQKNNNAIFEAFKEGTEPKETSDDVQKKKTSENFFMNE